MLVPNETSKVEELMPREEPSVVDIGPETHPSSRASLPSVVQLQKGMQDVPPTLERVNSEYPSPMDKAGKAELDSLLSRYDEFKDSETIWLKCPASRSRVVDWISPGNMHNKRCFGTIRTIVSSTGSLKLP